MEVGAVKQAFNNEVILLKKKLNQAKIQIINKLTRKAKQLTEKKAPEKLKEKLKRKAESAIKEVLIIKKIKARDIAKFIVTHTRDLKTYLNSPQVDNDKACARLLLHKSMQEKYNFIRNRFSNVPIKDLFMSRQERLKLKKEEKEKQKNKKKDKKHKAINKEGAWNVEDIDQINVTLPTNDDKDNYSNDDVGESLMSDNESIKSNVSNEGSKVPMEKDNHSDTGDQSNEEISGSENNDDETSDIENNNDEISGSENNDDEVSGSENNDDDISDNDNSIDEKPEAVEKFVKLNPVVLSKKLKEHKTSEKSNNLISLSKNVAVKEETKFSTKVSLTKKTSASNKVKDTNKNRNLNEKIQQKKFKKTADGNVITDNKVVDPFFITSTGEHYMSLAEPRQPDEVKEIHKQGNRKLRRAVMFGHELKVKPRNNYDSKNNNDRFSNNFRGRNDRNAPNGRNSYNNKNVSSYDKNSDANDRNSFDGSTRNFNNKRTFADTSKFVNMDNDKSKEEKLHPSWEAKKRQSGILPFKGKKIVFDES